MSENIKINQCPEFPYFGAKYPDATCIEGLLWDLDSSDDGMLTQGGEEPCPFCNTESFIEQHKSDEYNRDYILDFIKSLRDQYDKPRNINLKEP